MNTRAYNWQLIASFDERPRSQPSTPPSRRATAPATTRPPRPPRTPRTPRRETRSHAPDSDAGPMTDSVPGSGDGPGDAVAERGEPSPGLTADAGASSDDEAVKSPDATTEATTDEASEVTTEEAPDATTDEAPEMATDETPEMTTEEAFEVTVDKAPPLIADEVTDAPIDEVSEAAADEVQDTLITDAELGRATPVPLGNGLVSDRYREIVQEQEQEEQHTEVASQNGSIDTLPKRPDSPVDSLPSIPDDTPSVQASAYSEHLL